MPDEQRPTHVYTDLGDDTVLITRMFQESATHNSLSEYEIAILRLHEQIERLKQTPRTLYFLEWDNGLEYEDHCLTLLGVYLTAESREAARRRCHAGEVDFYFSGEGAFVESEITADADLFVRTPH